MNAANHKELKVSVWMIAYNQEDYIERAIDSVLMQKTDFRIELVIGDDSSTDRTRELCEAYQQKYPEILRYEYNTVNIGMQQNVLKTYHRCNGQYVALLEGDDEWTDPYKLAKQVKLLDEQNDVVMCYSNARINDTKNSNAVIYFRENNKPKQQMNKYEVVHHCVVPTCTVMFRNKVVSIPEWFVKAKASAYFLFYLLSKKGDLYYMDEPLALYNHHYSGMSRKTAINEMLYSDALLNYGLVPYFDGDREMYRVVIEKNINAINDLFHRRAFGKAVRLFWKLPFLQVVKSNRLVITVSKLFIKTHFLFFLSKNEQKGTY
ncbi:MAG: glycosyltransferase [Chitinophagaceae bacterium]|nr:glycosyltransferase [Chitinophagaceae bacterium]